MVRLFAIRLRFDPDSIIHGGADALFAAQVSFGGLDRNMAKQKLDLLQFASRYVAQPSAPSAQVVRRQFFDASFRSELADNVPDDLLGHTLTPDPPSSVDPTKHSSGSKSRTLDPNVKDRLHPIRHRNRPNVTRLAHEIDNGPMLLSLLQVSEVQFHGFVPPQAAG